MTTPLNKLADEWREEASQYDPESVHIRATLLQAADELEAALSAHNQRWLDLADELEDARFGEPYRLAAQRIRQLAKEMGE